MSVAVELFQLGPKWWKIQLTDIAMSDTRLVLTGCLRHDIKLNVKHTMLMELFHFKATYM